MWVIYNAQTGIELDRAEHYGEAKNIQRAANLNKNGDRFNVRWED